MNKQKEKQMQEKTSWVRRSPSVGQRLIRKVSLKETASEMSWNWTDGPETEEMGP